MSDEETIKGSWWDATRTPDGCRLTWLTNHPVVHFMSAVATAEITEADFELLRDDPDSADSLIRQYEPVAEID